MLFSHNKIQIDGFIEYYRGHQGLHSDLILHQVARICRSMDRYLLALA